MPDTPHPRWTPAETPLPPHGWAVGLVLAGSVLAAVLLIQAGLALAFSSLRAATAYARAQKPLDRGAAGLMGAFGLSLLWTAG